MRRPEVWDSQFRTKSFLVLWGAFYLQACTPLDPLEEVPSQIQAPIMVSSGGGRGKTSSVRGEIWVGGIGNGSSANSFYSLTLVQNNLRIAQ